MVPKMVFFLNNNTKLLSGPGEELYKLWCVKPIKSTGIIISFFLHWMSEHIVPDCVCSLMDL